MSDETPVPEPKKAPKAGGTRGPKPKAVVEAETEARVRAEMDAEMEALRERARVAEEKAAQSAEQPDVAALVAKEVAKALEAKEEPLDPAVQEFVTPSPKQITADDVQGDLNAEGSITVHFVADGFTALGKVWYIGEELTLTPDTPEWEQALLHDGTERVFAQLDEDEQIIKYGERKFREGLWRGRTFDFNDPNLSDEEKAALQRAHEKRLQRTGVPAPN